MTPTETVIIGDCEFEVVGIYSKPRMGKWDSPDESAEFQIDEVWWKGVQIDELIAEIAPEFLVKLEAAILEKM